MTLQREKDIKTIAIRTNKILNETKGLPLPSMFWEDVNILLKLILEEEKGE